jgi:hypothetical protein
MGALNRRRAAVSDRSCRGTPIQRPLAERVAIRTVRAQESLSMHTAIRTAFVNIALATGACVAAIGAHAQTTAPQPVTWELQVVRDGQQIDSFAGTTNVGQARTDTHHDKVHNRVGCADQPAGDIDLQRTVTVSPTHASADDITLAIDSQETLQDDSTRASPSGCKLPPVPRQVSGSHPGLMLKPGEWGQWQIIESNPSLTYRVRATLGASTATH